MNKQKIMHLLILTIALTTGLIIAACQKDTEPYVFPDPGTLPEGLIGTWIEASSRIDTIVFTSNSDTSMFWLYRGYRMVNGYQIPAIGSGNYEFRIIPDSIRIRWGLSSTWEPATYYFKFNDSDLVINIGHFTSFTVNEDPLTFRKIK
jgi:hypothetical protein